MLKPFPYMENAIALSSSASLAFIKTRSPVRNAKARTWRMRSLYLPLHLCRLSKRDPPEEMLKPLHRECDRCLFLCISAVYQNAIPRKKC
ncbi:MULTISPECIES: hypothetical protein [Cyanophyceae]|uniref:hypothetical protein n=1 Tax=Cyanophyceae TaxID=3028117 RepID=UPI0016855425|nr:hypothetical protein [Trichocoleus sp. FACHB-69]MBD1935053.1 hypothetical protein [Trichocoleus sp. FACHB-69]